MTPFHQGYVLQLRTTTALSGSLAWNASENIREIYEREGRPYTVAPALGLQSEIEAAILLADVKRKLGEKVN